jgi:hypothetical protein
VQSLHIQLHHLEHPLEDWVKILKAGKEAFYNKQQVREKLMQSCAPTIVRVLAYIDPPYITTFIHLRIVPA